MDEEMRFIDFIRPPLEEGKYHILTTQQVTVSESESRQFQEEADFLITGNAFTLDANDVFSVFPGENETGKFGNSLPFIVLNKRTYPWDRSVCPDRNGVPVPWVALIVISADEGAVEREMLISELLSCRDETIFFPEQSKMPPVFIEKTGDSCHVLELPVKLYDDITPSADDLTYLCHVRSVNLRRTEDAVCKEDGFFSVICANRFVPSGDGEYKKSTVHLVSMAGYVDAKIPDQYSKVRLVSLYHWDIYSQNDSDEGFGQVADRLKKNCGAFNYHMDSEEKRQGYCAMRHVTRSGEQTYSLYRSPLIPFINHGKMNADNAYTSDGHLIYDKKKGVFDVTFAAAWQLGRLITLSNASISEKILRLRKERKLKSHHNALKSSVDFGTLDLETVVLELAEKNILSREEETDEKT